MTDTSDRSERRVLSLTGLAQRAGQVVSGETAVEAAIRAGQASVVLLSADASQGTFKKFSHRCFFYKVPLVQLDCSKKELGKAIGKGERSVAGICGEGFAKSILDLKKCIEV